MDFSKRNKMVTFVSLYEFTNPNSTTIRKAFDEFVEERLTPSDILHIKAHTYAVMAKYLIQYANSLSALSPSIDYRISLPLVSKWVLSLCGLVLGIDLLASREWDKLYVAYERITVSRVVSEVLNRINSIKDVTADNQNLYIAAMECLLKTLTDDEKAGGLLKLTKNFTITTNYDPLVVGSTESKRVDTFLRGNAELGGFETQDETPSMVDIDETPSNKYVVKCVNTNNVRQYIVSEASTLNVLLLRAEYALSQCKDNDKFLDLLNNHRVFKKEIKRFKKKPSLIAENKALLDIFRENHSLSESEKLFAVDTLMKQRLLMSVLCVPSDNDVALVLIKLDLN